ncbi:AraC family transcriptional regulator [Cellulophaga baltica]|uniref:helix-turn-helix domain-containing protein n=1 Tax=Cellulophaga TaxID=104264 RepID=UPI001C06E4C2|nr:MULTISPECIES: AraC family transcriptional regulator [Cellulophaga]MBU2996467.1 AraC family transcriptional regulator [Cellulophaga baltica]MDO6767861.1 AraC family transcriptional regulator [Cellulophaga sp. 1_MG-2023]
MIKKRREIKVAAKKNIISLNDELAELKNKSTKDNVTACNYEIKPEYGIGNIHHFTTDNVSISISRFFLKKDFLYALPIQNKLMQINFLLTGEKIIYFTDRKEIFYESKESYLVNINGFNGSNRILGKKLFKEIKINIPLNFLKLHGLMTNSEIKTINDSNLILPITDELYGILENFERKHISDITNNLYLKAKIFELIAIQLKNYRDRNNGNLIIGNDKTLKRLYSIKQTINNNIHKNYTIQEIGEDFGVTGNTLNKDFTRIFGCSINEYSKQEKMLFAKNLLENSEKLIYQIAEETGYKNATHFTAAFKRMYGTTPKEYRNKM